MAKRTASHETSRAGIPFHGASPGIGQPASLHPSVSDITIAKTIASAVRATRGVVDLSPGLLALAATYGPNERLVGVVVRHSGLHATDVDVHVTVAMAATRAADAKVDASSLSTPSTSLPAPKQPPGSAVLTYIASQVREAVYRAMQALRLEPPSTVNVYMDDIQVGA